MSLTTRVLATAALALAATLSAPLALAAKEYPPVSPEGLELRKSKLARVVYVRPGADFSKYQRVAILECPVAFDKDWLRDNDSGPGRVDGKDQKRIQDWLSAEFLAVFTRELQDKGGYSVVKEGAPDVLVLRPAILDLTITAPDSQSTAGRNYTFADSAGSMTIYLELYDSVTSQLLARIIDPEASRGAGRIQWQNEVTNKAEADRILARWADRLRERLDEVNGKAAAQ